MTARSDAHPLAVEADRLTVNYGRTPGIRDVRLAVPAGEYLGIIGPNGGGKTTLLKAILGLVPVTEGRVSIFGTPAAKGRGRVGYVPQFSTVNRTFPITVEDAVLTGRVHAGLTPFFRYGRHDRAVALETMARVGVAPLRRRQVAELSGGEFQKVLIARALATTPDILLLDEPTASVDAASRGQIFTLLKELNREMTILLVTHDLLAVSSQVTALACLSGTLLYYGKPDLSPEVLVRIFGSADVGIAMSGEAEHA